MNNPAPSPAPGSHLAPTRTPAFEARLKKRYAKEKRFRLIGLGSIIFSIAVLFFLLGNMTINGLGGFQRVEMNVPIDFTESGITGDANSLSGPAGIRSLDSQGLPAVVEFYTSEAVGDEGAQELSSDAWRELAQQIVANPALLRQEIVATLPASADLAAGYAGEGSPEMIALASELSAQGKLEKNFDFGFLTRSDATDPQLVGIWGALKGSILTMLITLAMAFPIGVLAALYLEEYALDRCSRSVDQQPRRCAIDHFWSTGTGCLSDDLSQLSLCSADRRDDAGSDDNARDRHLGPQCD